PVARGSPPVINAVPPGSESDGSAAWALLNSAPPWTSFASSELGWFATYHSRSDWWIPSTEIKSTCLMRCLPGEAAATEAAPTAKPAASKLRSRTRRTTTYPPHVGSACRAADLHRTDPLCGLRRGDAVVADRRRRNVPPGWRRRQSLLQ